MQLKATCQALFMSYLTSSSLSSWEIGKACGKPEAGMDSELRSWLLRKPTLFPRIMLTFTGTVWPCS